MLRQIASARWFQNFITVVIVLASVLVGVETYPEIEKQYHRLLHTLDLLIIGIFTLEVVIKIGPRAATRCAIFAIPGMSSISSS